MAYRFVYSWSTALVGTVSDVDRGFRPRLLEHWYNTSNANNSGLVYVTVPLLCKIYRTCTKKYQFSQTFNSLIMHYLTIYTARVSDFQSNWVNFNFASTYLNGKAYFATKFQLTARKKYKHGSPYRKIWSIKLVNASVSLLFCHDILTMKKLQAT